MTTRARTRSRAGASSRSDLMSPVSLTDSTPSRTVTEQLEAAGNPIMLKLWLFAKSFAMYEASNGRTDTFHKAAEVLYLPGGHLMDATKTLNEIFDTYSETMEPSLALGYVAWGIYLDTLTERLFIMMDEWIAWYLERTEDTAANIAAKYAERIAHQRAVELRGNEVHDDEKMYLDTV